MSLHFIFKTTDKQRKKLIKIVEKMYRSTKLKGSFIRAAEKVASNDQGAFDLMAMWSKAKDKSERKKLISCIQDTINEYVEFGYVNDGSDMDPDA